MRLINFDTLYKFLSGEVNNRRWEETKVFWENALKGLPHDFFFYQNKFFKEVENRVP